MNFALIVSGTIKDRIETFWRAFTLAAYLIESESIIKDWTGVRFCFIKDFDGLSIEFRENKRN